MGELDLSISQQEELLKWLHSVIGDSFGYPEKDEPSFLKDLPPCGAFVTLHLKGELRGCIGHLQSDRNLGLTLRDAATSAAFRDYRFIPLTEDEWKEIDLEVSILSPMEEVSGPGDIRLGEHGALLEADRGRGLFLPQVATEQNWDIETFMNHLCRKAGLPHDYWLNNEYRLYRFTARIYP